MDEPSAESTTAPEMRHARLIVRASGFGARGKNICAVGSQRGSLVGEDGRFNMTSTNASKQMVAVHPGSGAAEQGTGPWEAFAAVALIDQDADGDEVGGHERDTEEEGDSVEGQAGADQDQRQHDRNRDGAHDGLRGDVALGGDLREPGGELHAAAACEGEELAAAGPASR